ncbi:hypothetical protein [Sphingobium sp.]|uniref:hypothetical protein n=1 Tax=Sphingobium sp. TaxID=1912891 RepID=UPI002E1FF3D1
MPSPSRPAPFRPRDYVQDDPDVRFWDEPRQRMPFIEEADAQIDADLRGVTRSMLLGFVCGIVGAALIWWVQS